MAGVDSGVCCARLVQPKCLMKIGLCMVLVGHVNFLLGGLVHGTVLRDVSLGIHMLEYAISNILALTAGLVGVIVGILAVTLSKNEKNRPLMWSLCMLSALGVLLAAASAVGLLIALVWVIANGSKALLLHCNIPDGMSYFSITTECPFDPTRIYFTTSLPMRYEFYYPLEAVGDLCAAGFSSTTIILWVPLILMSGVEVVFSGRCLAISINFIRGNPAPQYTSRSVKTLQAAEPPVLPYYAPPPRRYQGDRKAKLPERPPEQHELLHASQRPYSSTRSAQNRPPPAHFDRAKLNRASFWI